MIRMEHFCYVNSLGLDHYQRSYLCVYSREMQETAIQFMAANVTVIQRAIFTIPLLTRPQLVSLCQSVHKALLSDTQMSLDSFALKFPFSKYIHVSSPNL